MNKEEAHKTWDQYHEKILLRRIAEAKIINTQLEESSISAETDLALDFSFFTKQESGSKGLVEQLSENYEVNSFLKDEYWHIEVTSRPYAVNLNAEQHLDWVKFMHDVALFHGAIFSVWSLTDPKTKKQWSNENIDSGL